MKDAAGFDSFYAAGHQRLLRQIPQAQRQAIVLHHLGGLSVADSAGIRRRGDRRTRHQALGSAAVAVALVAGRSGCAVPSCPTAGRPRARRRIPQ